ncbi:MAG: hypothetical protein IPM13_18480 [Phycisphaerales bacterium]|nr:hypothetical protein [Phycisphaerales bacterium]
MTMSAEGELAVTTGNGAVPFVMVEARPRVLMTIFAEHVDEIRRIAKATASVGAASSGMKPAQMAGFMDAFFDFPAQIEVLTVTVDGDQDKGWEAHAEVVPRPGSGFESGVALLRPSGKGVPQIRAAGIMSWACDLHPTAMQAVFGGMGELVATMVDEADRPAVRKLMDTQAAASDGTMTFAIAAGAIHMVLGCSDSEAMRKMMGGDDWVRMQRAFLQGMPDAEVEIEREQSGDLEILHTLGDLGTDINPFAKDGKLEGWATVAGDAMVSVVNGDRKTFDDLVRAAVAGELDRAPLPGGAVMTMRMDMAGLLAMSGQAAPPGVPLRMPSSIDVRVGKKAKSVLVVDVKVGM